MIPGRVEDGRPFPRVYDGEMTLVVPDDDAPLQEWPIDDEDPPSEDA